MASALSVSAPVGAQPLYLHSPVEQATTEAVAAGIDAARVAHLAALDRHETNLTVSIAREREVHVRRALARRDAELTRYLNAESDDARTARLRLVMKTRLAELTTLSGPVSGPPFIVADGPPTPGDKFASNLVAARRQRLEHDSLVAEFRRATALAEQRGQVVPECDETLELLPVETSTPAATVVEDTCQNVRQSYPKLRAAVTCRIDDASLAVLAMAARIRECSDGSAVRKIDFGGAIDTAFTEHAKLSDALARQRQAAAAVKKHLEDLEAYLACELEDAKSPGATERVREAAKRIDGFLAEVAALPEAIRAAAPAAKPPPESARLICPGAKSGVAFNEETLAVITKALGVTAIFEETRAIAAGAKAAAHEFRAGKLGEILNFVATPASEAEGRTSTIVAALVNAATPLETLGKVRAGTLPDTSGALVALAEARMRAAIARAEAERLTQLVALSQLKTAAITNEAIALRQGIGAMTRIAGRNPDLDAAALGEAALFYADSVARGRVPFEVIVLDMDNVEYAAWTRRERAAVEAGYAALAPAAAELKAYGAGGIQADTIARFLNVAGLGAIAGTN